MRAYAGDYFDILQSGALRFDPHHAVLALCLGSNIGNYHPSDVQRLCSLLAATLRPGDALLLGTDLKKDPATLERAYDDAGGVMDSFSRNLLTRLNRELGANFDPRDFHLVAHYGGFVAASIRGMTTIERTPCICSFAVLRSSTWPSAEKASWGVADRTGRLTGFAGADARLC